METTKQISALALLISICSSATAQIRISEIRIDQPGSDTDEYFEIAGPPGADLSYLTYVVVGDGSSTVGVIESVTSLDGLSVPADGYLLVAEETFSLEGLVDLVASLNFENGDNVTHLLVSDFTGSTGDDLDENDDGFLDLVPWKAIEDCIAILHEVAGVGDPTYCQQTIGPEGGPPWHVFRDGVWMIGSADTADGTDTPGEPVAGLPVEIESFQVLLLPESVLFQWRTVRERENAGFEVERETGSGVSPSKFVEATSGDRSSQYQLRDDRPSPGIHVFRLRQYDLDGTSSIVAKAVLHVPVPGMLTIVGPYPNPAYERTQFSISSESESEISARLMDSSGRTVQQLLDRRLAAGESYTSSIRVADIAAGQYFIHVDSRDQRFARPLLILR